MSYLTINLSLPRFYQYSFYLTYNYIHFSRFHSFILCRSLLEYSRYLQEVNHLYARDRCAGQMSNHLSLVLIQERYYLTSWCTHYYIYYHSGNSWYSFNYLSCSMFSILSIFLGRIV